MDVWVQCGYERDENMIMNRLCGYDVGYEYEITERDYELSVWVAYVRVCGFDAGMDMRPKKVMGMRI